MVLESKIWCGKRNKIVSEYLEDECLAESEDFSL
jgi:hypothetical protein